MKSETFDRTTSLQAFEFLAQSAGAGMTFLRIMLAGLEHDRVELGQQRLFLGSRQVGGQLRELTSVLSRGYFVQQLAETEDIGLRGAGTFGREEAFGAYERLGGVDAGDQPDVGELGHTPHEDDVRGFDVAMDQAVTVEMLEGGRQRQGDIEAFSEWKSTAGAEQVLERFGKVKIRI